jgi:hypothetical protein
MQEGAQVLRVRGAQARARAESHRRRANEREDRARTAAADAEQQQQQQQQRGEKARGTKGIGGSAKLDENERRMALTGL